MPLSALWTNYINTYPTGDQPGITSLANSAYNPPNNLDLPGYAQSEVTNISDILVTTPAADYNTLSASRIRTTIQNIMADCTPQEEIDDIFSQQTGDLISNGVKSLVNTLNENPSNNVNTIIDLYNNMTDASLATAIAALPCYHYFNLARAESELSMAKNYLNSVTSRYQGRFKLNSTTSGGLTDLFVTSVDDSGNVLASSTSNSYGNVNFPFEVIDDGSSPSPYILNIMVYDTNGNPLLTVPADITLPYDNEADLPVLSITPPDPVSFTSSTVSDVLIAEYLGSLPPDLQDYLNGLAEIRESLVPNLRDIRQVGGIQNDPLTTSTIRGYSQSAILDAHADLELLSLSLANNKALREASYSSLYSISRTPRSVFISDTYTILGDFNALAMHQAASAVVSYFNNYAINWRAQNGK